MLKFKLIKNNDAEIQYAYYPEGKNDLGIVSYNKITDDYSIVMASEKDQHHSYAWKMISRLRKYVEAGTFKEEGMVAWY